MKRRESESERKTKFLLYAILAIVRFDEEKKRYKCFHKSVCRVKIDK